MRNVKLTFFWVCRTLGLFQLARWLTRHHLKILCYHGFELVDECDFRPKLFIKAKQFEMRLATIRRLGMRAAPLDEAVEQLYSRSLPANTIVITIDDGFQSTFDVAVPLLKQYACAATVYVTTYYVENPSPVFRLLVQYMFFSSKQPELVLTNVCWSADGVVTLADCAQAEKAMWDCINYGERAETEAVRRAICAELGELLKTPYSDIERSKIFHLMTPEQLQALAAADVRVALHTQRHSFSEANQSLAEREIADNRLALQRADVDWIDHFCYPSGLWNERQASWLDGMGVKSSTTCLPGLNSAGTPRHGMRRFLDGDNIHQLEFEAALSGFSDLLRALVQVPRGVMRLTK